MKQVFQLSCLIWVKAQVQFFLNSPTNGKKHDFQILFYLMRIAAKS